MTILSYTLDPVSTSTLGLVVLQGDLRIEGDMRRLLSPELTLLVSRVPAGRDVTLDSLQEIGAHLTASASLFPEGQPLAAVGYGCTSGTAQLTPEGVAQRVHGGCDARAVTEPLSALRAACAAMGVRRLALLSPYVAPVSQRLRDVLAVHGIETPVFGSFDVAEEARVARIAPAATIAAARALMDGPARAQVDGLFLSCTNLPTLDVIAPLEDALDMPVLSSNLVLGWHLARLAGGAAAADAPGRLFAQHPPGGGVEALAAAAGG